MHNIHRYIYICIYTRTHILIELIDHTQYLHGEGTDLLCISTAGWLERAIPGPHGRWWKVMVGDEAPRHFEFVALCIYIYIYIVI